MIEQHIKRGTMVKYVYLLSSILQACIDPEIEIENPLKKRGKTMRNVGFPLYENGK